MSEYVTAEFFLPKGHKLKQVKTTLYELFDSWNITDTGKRYGKNSDVILYELTVHELNLEETIKCVLSPVKKKHPIDFVITHGVF